MLGQASKQEAGILPLSTIEFIEELICIEKNGFYVKISLRLKELLGYSDAEFQSKPSLEFVHPKDREFTGQQLSLLSTGSANTVAYENRLLSKKGEYIPIAWQAKKHSESEYCYCCLPRDIRKERQAELLASFFEVSPNLLCIIDKNWRFQLVCDTFEFLLGYKKTELLLEPSTHFVHPEDLAEYLAKMRKLLETADNISFEVRFLAKDGSHKNISWNAQQKDELVYAVGADITQVRVLDEQIFKERQDQARYYQETQADKARKTEFMGNLCHELRNPLAGISGSIDILESNIQNLRSLIMELELDTSKKELVGKLKGQLQEMQGNAHAISECAQHQRVILNDTLVLSKLESGAFELNTVEFNPKVVVESVLLMLQSTASKKGISLFVDLPAKDIVVLGDVNWLKNILLNIISNAIKFTEKGSVHVKLIVVPAEIDTELQFCIRDTGVGLTSEETNRLFKRFSQSSVNEYHCYAGSGLGLFITKQIIEKMGGTVRIESEKGKGSSVIFNVKTKNVARESAVEAEAIARKTCADADVILSTISRNILMVEDNNINQRVTKRMLESAGHKVVAANNGKEAIELWEKGGFDLILMDIQMPVMDGIEATIFIRQKEEELQKPKIPIIGLSANALGQDLEKGITAGMNDYMTKPFSKEELLQKIECFTIPAKLVTGTPPSSSSIAASLGPTPLKQQEGRAKERKAKEGKGGAPDVQKEAMQESQKPDIALSKEFLATAPAAKKDFLKDERLQNRDFDYSVKDKDGNNLCYHFAIDPELHTQLLKVPDSDFFRLMLVVNQFNVNAVKGLLSSVPAELLTSTTIVAKLASHEPTRVYMEGLRLREPEIAKKLEACRWLEMLGEVGVQP